MNSIIWTSPIVSKVKEKIEDPLKLFKKPKCKISKGTAKKITGYNNIDSNGCQWIERWIENLVRGNCYPISLLSDDFYASLPQIFAPDKVLSILEAVRKDYKQAFPLSNHSDDENLDWLYSELVKDPVVMKDFENLLSV
jgi:hypothetical protein